MHAADAISDHPDLLRVWDTRKLRPGDDIRGVGNERDGKLVTYHLTDDPKRVLAAIKKKGNLLAAYGAKGETAELGAGLYASGIPEFWASRAYKKWDFLDTLEAERRAGGTTRLYALIEKLGGDVDRDHRLSPAERERAMRDFKLVVDGVYDTSGLIFAANQPYGVPFWKPEYLEPLGITPGAKPQIVELELQGTFAELSRSYPDAKLLRMLRRAGVSGAFTRSSMATNPEIVLWDVKAIKSAKPARIEAYEAREARETRGAEGSSMAAMASVQAYRLALKKAGKVTVAPSKISGPDVARAVAYGLLHDAPVEHVLAIGLDGNLNVLGVITAATIGAVSNVMLDPSIAIKAALTMNATGLIIAHNHPSGDPRPSDDDKAFTERLIEGCKLVGVPLLDHIIITRYEERSYSFNAQGLIR